MEEKRKETEKESERNGKSRRYRPCGRERNTVNERAMENVKGREWEKVTNVRQSDGEQ